ncbi:hypothetical protein Tco_1182008 [Tanacetum coccineum]
MPIESNEPPDLLFDELCSLTKMTSSEEIRDASLNVTKVKVMKGTHRKPYRGSKIKVSTPGSAGASSVLRRLRSAKVAGKAHGRADGYPSDNRGGKRVVFTPMNDEISKVLSDVKSGVLNSNLKISLGCSNDNSSVCALNNEVDVNDLSNDGSFIKSPLDSGMNVESSPVAKSCGLKTSPDHTSMGDVGNASCGFASSKDGIAIAETKILSDKEMAGSGNNTEHTSMEDVVSTCVVQDSSQDGIASYKVGSGFKFGKNTNASGILKKPDGPLFSVQFGNISNSNPFSKKHVVPIKGVWNDNRIKAFGSSILSNKFSAVVDRFAETLKQGAECMANKMEYMPDFVCKLDNRNRRINFTAEEVYKGEQTCSLQLYGYFVGTSMDYRVVRGNLMRMWRWPMDGSKCSIGFECAGTGKITSGVGKPLLMDKITRDKCLNKVGKMDFARVLVKVSAEYDLPNVLEIEYPPLGNRPARVGKLKEEIVAKTIKDAIELNNPVAAEKNLEVEGGFVTVGRKNRSVVSQAKNVNNRGFKSGNQFSFGNQKQNGNRQGIYGGGNYRRNVQQNNGVSRKASNQDKSRVNFGKRNNGDGVQKKKSGSNVGDKSSQGSCSKNNPNLVSDEAIHVKNAFNVFREVDGDTEDMGNINVNEEFEAKVWLELRKPYYKDDEVDMESDDEGIAGNIKPEFKVRAANIHTIDRRSLWKALHKHKLAIKDRPWVILGDFNACLDPSERSSGCSKKKKPGVVGGLLKKLDRVLGNVPFMTSFPTAYVIFLPFMLSDHTPAVFVIPEVKKSKPNPFKFHNYLSSKDDFIPTAKNVWSNKVEGVSMFFLISKLKMLKKPLRKLNYDQGNLFENVKRLRAELAIAQSFLCSDPHNALLREVEAKAYKSSLKDEKNIISYIKDLNGNAFHGNDVGEQFVRHFKSVLGSCSKVNPIKDPVGLFSIILPVSKAEYMIRSVSNDEIKKALFEINGNKAPDPDGFSAQLKGVLGPLVDENQSAFIPSRQISDNILLSQELMRGYHINRGFAKCAFKVDIQKAYDSVEWEFLASCLKAFGFHDTMTSMRGLRQGDPLSPYLFMLVMEVFNLVLKRQISRNPSFKYHWLYKEVSLTYLCFADDLLLFCHGDSKSASVLKKALDEFGVADILKNGEWEWPSHLACKFDGLSAIHPPCLVEGKPDKVVWRNYLGKHKYFSVSDVWNDIKSKSDLVPWSRLVWLKDVVKLDHAPNSWKDIIVFLLARPINKSI